MIRYLGMRIVGVEDVNRGVIAGNRIARCAMICLVENAPQCYPGGTWGPEQRIDREFTEYLPPQEYAGSANHHDRAKPKAFDAQFYRPGLQSLDLTKVLNSQPEVEPNNDLSVLHQSDKLY